MSLSKTLYPLLGTVQHRKTCFDMTKIVDWDVKNQKHTKSSGSALFAKINKTFKD